MTKLITANVVQIVHWTKILFSIKLIAQIDPFIAGQFTKLAVKKNNSIIQRAYSYVNAPSNSVLEFYITSAVNGKLSPILNSLKIGDNILISKKSSGSFTLNNIPQCRDLWMIATGTAIGPYLSILQEQKDTDKFENIVLVHAVRYAHDLNYLLTIKKMKQIYKRKLIVLTIVSREKSIFSIKGRIPKLMQDGILEEKTKLEINKKHSHIMLCGNPGMITDTMMVLKRDKGMCRHLASSKGHISTERYW